MSHISRRTVIFQRETVCWWSFKTDDLGRLMLVLAACVSKCIINKASDAKFFQATLVSLG